MNTPEEAKLIEKELNEVVDHIEWFKTLTHTEQEVFRKIVSQALLSTHRTAREEGRREGARELKRELDGLVKEPTLCGKCNLVGKLCRECYANRRANSVLVEVAALIDARIGK